MVFRILEFLAFTSLIVAFLSATLALLTFKFINQTINYQLVLLIFFGALTIYNTDHLRGLVKDRISNPKRVFFIKSNLKVLYILTAVSLILSVFFLFKSGTDLIPVLIVPFILGLVHRRLKKFGFLSALYVTLSWIIVTIILPAFVSNMASSVYWLAAIIGLPLFCNAYISTVRDEYSDSDNTKGLLILSLISLFLALILDGRYYSVIPIPLITAIVLLKYNNNELYELIYMDGSQVAGAAIALILISYVL